MEFDEIAKKCRQLAYEGKDYEAIIAAIPYQSFSKNQQKEIRSLINDFIVQYTLAEQVKSKYITQIMLGGVALLLGIFILLFTYFRQESSYTIGLAACLIGLYVIKKGYDEYKKPIDFQDIAPEKDSKFHRY